MPVPLSARSLISVTLLLASFLCNACVYRPLPGRTSIDELIQEAIDHSDTYTIVDESTPNVIGGGYVGEDGILYSRDVAGLLPNELHPADSFSTASEIASRDVIDSSLLIREEFIETDVREVLAVLTSEANLDLVLDDNVGGIVNTNCNDLTFEQAIEKVLMPLGLAYSISDGQVVVAPPDPLSPLFSRVSVKRNFRPLHMAIRSLLDSVPAAWLQYVTPIDSAKLLLVQAPPRIVDEIFQRFEAVDQPVPLVVLEAIICVISPDSGFQFGLDWEHAVKLDSAKALAIGASGLALNGQVSNAGLSEVFGSFSSTSTFIKLLREHGYLTIRASPHVMAKDGEQANIAINRETFFSVQPASSQGSNAVFFQQDIQKVDAGITLDITPHIRGDVVTIDIEKAEVSEDVRTANSELSVNPFPVINRRSVSTTVSVKDRKTIVIGGLVQRETIDQVNQIPGLSRLPLVGYLFQTTERQTRDAEVVIFISPRIVHAGETAVCQSTFDGEIIR